MSVDLSLLRARHVALLESELARLVDELKAFGAHLIVLFGSYAQGRRDLFTDLDLLAVIDSDEPFLQRLATVRGTLRPKVDTDLFVYSPSEFEEMKERPFVRHVLKMGKVLYVRE